MERERRASFKLFLELKRQHVGGMHADSNAARIERAAIRVVVKWQERSTKSAEKGRNANSEGTTGVVRNVVSLSTTYMHSNLFVALSTLTASTSSLIATAHIYLLQN
jgi:hypothetical protein